MWWYCIVTLFLVVHLNAGSIGFSREFVHAISRWRLAACTRRSLNTGLHTRAIYQRTHTLDSLLPSSSRARAHDAAHTLLSLPPFPSLHFDLKRPHRRVTSCSEAHGRIRQRRIQFISVAHPTPRPPASPPAPAGVAAAAAAGVLIESPLIVLDRPIRSPLEASTTLLRHDEHTHQYEVLTQHETADYHSTTRAHEATN
jgi:hypothetical protein